MCLYGDVREHVNPEGEAGVLGEFKRRRDHRSALPRLVGVAVEIELHIQVSEVVPTPATCEDEEDQGKNVGRCISNNNKYKKNI